MSSPLNCTMRQITFKTLVLEDSTLRVQVTKERSGIKQIEMNENIPQHETMPV